MWRRTGKGMLLWGTEGMWEGCTIIVAHPHGVLGMCRAGARMYSRDGKETGKGKGKTLFAILGWGGTTGPPRPRRLHESTLWFCEKQMDGILSITYLS